VSSRSLARRPRHPGRRPIPPRSSTRSRGEPTSPRGGVVSRYLPAAVIAAGIVAVVVVALGQLGTSSSSARTETQIVTASEGVVQSTVSGTGSLEPVTEEDVDFQTSGTLAHVYVKEGDHVHKGQLLATLGDTTAALTLKQARATLAEARTTLSSDEANESSGSDTSATVDESSVAEDVSYSPTSSTSTQTVVPTQTITETVTAPESTTTPATATTPTETTQTSTATTTEPAQPTTTTSTGSTRSGSGSTSSTGSSSTGSSTSGSSTSGSSTTGSSASGSSTSGSSTSGSSTVTAATVDADKLQVVEDEQAVKEDRQALDQTRLRAPVSGTITSLQSIAPGDSVSSGSTSSADSSSASTSTTGSTAVGSSTGSTSSSSSTTSSFAVIDSLKQLSMTVSFTEADINKLKVGQSAVVTLDALSDLKLAGKVSDVSSIGTTSDDVTSYDATVALNQYDSRVKPGMSASAEVVIKQGHGVTVPTGAVTGSGNLATVTEDLNGKRTTKKVIVGLRGDSRDLIVSGLSSGAQLVETETLPSLGSSASSSSSSSSSASGALSRRSATGLAGGFSGGFSGGGFSGAGGGGPP
jgi:HlyD family secretion protein